MTAPASGSKLPINKPIGLAASATCPGKGLIQFWVKPNGAPNWTAITDFTTATTATWTAPDEGAWNLTAVARSQGSSNTFDVRASSITISVVAAPAPTAVNDTLAVTMSTPASIDLAANDQDPSGNGITVTGTTQPAHGNVTLAGTVATYTPTPGFSGSDSFSYTIGNGTGFSSTASVAITVTAVTPSCTIAISGPQTGVIGAPIALTATASCNVGTPEIQWSASSGGNPFTVFQAFSTATTVNFDSSNAVAGDNQFTAVVRSQGTTPAFAANTIDVAVADDVAPCTAVVISAPVAGQFIAPGQPVPLSAVVTCPSGLSGEVQWLGTPAGAQSAKQVTGFVTGPTSFVPSIAGDWQLQAVARSVGSHVPFQVQSAAVTISITNSPKAVDDALVIDEDTVGTINVLANDSDPNGDALTATIVTGPTSGTAALDPSGALTYTPAPDYHGSDSIVYSVSDSSGNTATATVHITINAVNDPPSAHHDFLTIAEDTSGSIDPTLNDTDVDGDALTVVSITQPASGTATLTGNIVTYTPAPNFNGSDSFQYTIADPSGATSTATIFVTVTPIDDPPVAADDQLTTPEDTAGSVFLLANDTDPDGETPTVVSFDQPAHGSVTVAAGFATYTPAPNFNGEDSFTYTIADSAGETSTATVHVTVLPVNDPPVAVADTASLDEDTSVIIDVVANDSDVDGDPLTVTSVSAPANGTAAIVSGHEVSYTPAANFNGTDSFTYTIADPSGATATATVTVTVNPVNDPPVAVADTASLDEDTTIAIDVLANDSDVDGDPLTIIAISQPAHGTAAIISGGLVSYTPAANFNGTDSFTYTIADPSGATATATVSLTINPVNDPPVAVDDSATLDEDTSATIDVIANDTDVDDDVLSVASVSQPAHGTAAIVDATHVSYTPAANYNGTDSFTYTVSDGNGGTAVATVTLTINPVNDPPVANADAATLYEDTSVVIDVVANDSDVDGDPLAIAAITQPMHGTAAVVDAHHVSYTPAPNYNGGDAFSYTIVDPSGAAATALVAITIIPVNDPPVAVDDSASLDEDTAVTVDVVANDSDVDGDALAIVSVTQPAHGTAMIVDAHHISYVPLANYNGPDALSYTISDGNGGTASAQLLLTVIPVNDPPVAVADAATLDEDTSVTVDVVANDSDVDHDPLTIVRITQPANGSATIADAHHISYTPAPNYNGSDSLSYTISDGNGGYATATLTLTINPVNDPPVAVADAATLDEDTSVTVDVVANDSDVDHDTLTITAITQPAHGTAVIADGHDITYTPAANYNGSDSFSYTISDGNGGTASATLTLTINPVNDPPVAADVIASTFNDTPVGIALIATDVDGDALSFAIASGPAHGTLGPIAGGQVTYTPAAGFVGSDSFTFTANDGQASSNVANVMITINRSVCGNGIREGREECDDGNTIAADGCESTCTLTCGSGTGAERATVDATSGHCFAAFDGVAHGYQDAAALCTSIGGHLPTLTSANEDAAAFSAVAKGDRPWLGGDDIASKSFAWITGEPFGYTNFGPGAPSGTPATCLAYQPDGTWADTACSKPASGALCEVELASTTPVFATGGTGTRAVAVADFNGDGFLDVAAVNQGSNSVGVLFGNGAGSFALSASYSVGSGPVAIASGDFDGDGLTDLAVVNASANTLSILRGGPGGAFTAGSTVSIGSGATSIAAGDLDGDGALDLVIGTGAGVQLLHNTGSGFTASTSLSLLGGALGIAVGDFDRDGKLDLAIITPAAIATVLSSGGGLLGLPISLSTATGNRAATAADLDGDGNLDLAVVGSAGITVYFGSPSGAFGNPVGLTALGTPQLVATGDFDGDGTADVVALSGNYAQLFHSAGSARSFAAAGPVIATGGSGASAAVAAKINADGAADLIVANTSTSTAALVLGSPAGLTGAHALPAGSGVATTITGDFNEDGRMDLALVDPIAGRVFINLQTPSGGYTQVQALATGVNPATNPGPTFGVTGDFDGDGHLDLAIVNATFNSVAITKGNGTGTFSGLSTPGVGGGSKRIAIGDLNGDNKPDLAVANASGVTILINNGNGGFGRANDLTLSGSPAALVIGEFTGDTKKDLAVATSGQASIQLLAGQGNGSFGAPTLLPIDSGSQSIVAVDIDGDGHLDLVTANTGANTVCILRGSGTGFAAAVSVPVGSQPVALAAADLDGDGQIDLVTGNAGTSDVTILHNDGGSFVGSSFSVGVAPSWLSISDVDKDGHLDITAASNSPFVTMLLSPR